MLRDIWEIQKEGYDNFPEPACIPMMDLATKDLEGPIRLQSKLPEGYFGIPKEINKKRVKPS